MNTKSDFADFHIDCPFTDTVTLRRDECGVYTNVPHLVTHHSPTGFEFGYGGSGPADLALNIVEAALHQMGYTGPRMPCFDGDCFDLAFALHQDFKRDFISGAGDDTIIPYSAIALWISENMARENVS